MSEATADSVGDGTPLSDLVVARRLRIGGRFQRGLFATRSIPAGTTIGTFEGELLTRDEILARIASGAIRNGVDPLEVGPDLYLNLSGPWLVANHSCEPNAGLAGRCDLVALRDIAEGEEITYDYATNSSVRNSYVMPFECRCGTSSCRRRIGNLASIPLERLRFYLSRGALQDYIRPEALELLQSAERQPPSSEGSPPANG